MGFNTLLDNFVSTVAAIPTQDQATSTVTGTGQNLSAAEGSILITVNSALMSTSTTLTVTLEESDVLTTGYTAIPAAALFDPATGAAATFIVGTDAIAVFQTLAVRKEQIKQYMRAVGTLATGSIKASFSVTFTYANKYNNFGS